MNHHSSHLTYSEQLRPILSPVCPSDIIPTASGQLPTCLLRSTSPKQEELLSTHPHLPAVTGLARTIWSFQRWAELAR